MAAFPDWPVVDDVIFGSISAALTAGPEEVIFFTFRYGTESFLGSGRRTQYFLGLGEPDGDISAAYSPATSF